MRLLAPLRTSVAALPTALLPFLAAVACGSPSGGGFDQPTADAGPAGPATYADSGALSGFGNPGAGACVPGAPSSFLNAICVCNDLTEVGVLSTHAPQGHASVGINGRFSAATGAKIQGDLTAYNGLTVGGLLVVRDNAVSTQSVDGVGVFKIGTDLSVGGDFTFGGELTVNGTLRLAQPASVIIPIHAAQDGPYVAPSGPPCGCDTGSLLPVVQEVKNAATHNDNAAHDMSTDGGSFIGLGKLTLTTGSYYFHDLTRLDIGKIYIQGAVSIYFDGNSVNVGVGQFQVAAGSSLDLYVAGVLATAGGVELGDPTHPEAFRLFIGGAGSMIATAGAQEWDGLIYAPEADINFLGVTEIHGAVFANTLSWAGGLDVSYVGGALAAAPSCPAPPPAEPAAK